MAPSADDVPTIEAVTPPSTDVAVRPPEPAPATLPALIGGRYRPVRLIARGGMGAVYEVVHANTGRRLALKIMLARSLLAPDLVERFRREARIHSFVKSEHIAQVFDADVAPELDGAPFLVMELLDGRDFERVCLTRTPTPTEVVDWMGQIAPALDGAHREGIVHRDLKPENVFLAEREGGTPIVKILDFGVAKMAAAGDANATVTGQILGTPRYMAPEQAAGVKEISAAADRFALGLIAFRLLCGRHYFSGDNWVSLLRDVARGPRQRPSALGGGHGPGFDAWFARACAFDPAARFATCAEQAEALAGALSGAPTGWRTARLAWVGIAAAACGLAGLVWQAGHSAAGSKAAVATPSPVRDIAASPPADPPPGAPAAPISTSPAGGDHPPVTTTAAGTVSRRRPTHPRRRADDGAPGPKAKALTGTHPPDDRIWDEP